MHVKPAQAPRRLGCRLRFVANGADTNQTPIHEGRDNRMQHRLPRFELRRQAAQLAIAIGFGIGPQLMEAIGERCNAPVETVISCPPAALAVAHFDVTPCRRCPPYRGSTRIQASPRPRHDGNKIIGCRHHPCLSGLAWLDRPCITAAVTGPGCPNGKHSSKEAHDEDYR